MNAIICMFVRHAVQYVLFNQQKHEKGTYSKIDEYSSLLGMKDALKIIQEFAKAKKMTLHIGRGWEWELDEGDSYLLKRGIQLI